MKLLELFVEFGIKGHDKVAKGIEAVKEQAGALEGFAQRAGAAMSSQFNAASDLLQRTLAQKLAPAIKATSNAMVEKAGKLQGLNRAQIDNLKTLVNFHGALTGFNSRLATVRDSLAAFGDRLKYAFGGAVLTVGGFVTAGIHASNMGDQLGLQFQRLGLAIAGAFRPEIELVIDKIRQLADWIGNLSDQTKQNIVYWSVMAAEFMVFLVIVPKIVSGIMMIVGAIRTLVSALIMMQAFSGPKGWAAIAAGAAIAAAAIVGTGIAMDAVASKASGGVGSRSALAPKVGGPEDITAAFTRMNVAALNATAGFAGSPEERAADTLERIEKGQIDTNRILGGQQPVAVL